MFEIIKDKLRRIKQKVLFERIHEFVNSKYCTGDKQAQWGWLLEFTCHTEAREPRKILYKDIQSFSKYVLETNTPYTLDEAARALRKFLNWCVLKKYMPEFPSENLRKPDENDIMNFMQKVYNRRGPMPDVNLIRKIRLFKDKQGMSFTDIAERLKEETGKKYYAPNLHKLYHHPITL
jgi:hypothetical protein